MKATGEVMAIDRTFGAALNKALRGLEQAGAGSLAEDPELARLDDLTLATATADDDEPIRWVDERPGLDVHAAPRSAAFLEPSDTRLWRLLALLRRGVPEAAIQAVDRHRAWFVAELGAAIALERLIVRRWARACSDPARRRGDATLLAAAKRAGFGDRDIAALTWIPSERLRETRLDGSGCGRASRWSTPAPRSSRPRRPYFYSTYAAAGSPPEAPPVARPAALVIGSGPGPDRAGDRVRLLRGAGRRHAAAAGLPGRDDQLQPRDGLDRLRRVLAALLRAARPGERAIESIDAERRLLRRRPLLPALVQFGGQTPLGLAAPLAAAASRCAARTSRPSTRPRSARGSPGSSTGSASRSPRAGMAHSLEEALAVADRIGYPVIVRPSFVIGGLAIDFATGPRTSSASLPAATSSTRPAGPHRRYLEGIEVDVDAVTDGEDVLIPGLIEHVERAGVHSGDSIGIFPPQTFSAATRS